MASTNPIISIATTLNATQFNSYATDGAFESAKGSSGSHGDVYYNTTSNVMRAYLNSSWRSVSSVSETETLTNKTLTSPTINAPTISGIKLAVSTVTTTYSVTSSDDIVLCSGTFTVTLPAASSSTNKVVYIKNISNGTVTVDGNSSETIDGSTTYTITDQYESVTLICDGSAWYIL